MKEIVMIYRLDHEQPLARHCKPLSEKASSTRRFWKVKERNFPVSNPQSLSLSVGDYVEIELPAGQAIRSAFLLFILPLLVFVIAYQISSFLNPAIQVLISAAAFAGSFLIPLLLKKLGRSEIQPHIFRKLTKEEAKELLSCNVGCAGCGGCG